MQEGGDTWSLSGKPGDIFKITFSRTAAADGMGAQNVSWTHVGNAGLTNDAIARRDLPVFHITGDWDNWGSSRMNWTGTHYQFFVELGDKAQASFCILANGNPFKA